MSQAKKFCFYRDFIKVLSILSPQDREVIWNYLLLELRLSPAQLKIAKLTKRGYGHFAISLITKIKQPSQSKIWDGQASRTNPNKKIGGIHTKFSKLVDRKLSIKNHLLKLNLKWS
jgi:hypothetical protein